MTMSVGLARIINDPEASVLTRKALGALSTPGLLVHDTGLSIDDDGRIIIKLVPDGGLQQNETGLSLAPEPVTFGIDSEVFLDSEEHDREWNARLTGSAPNYMESGLAIGAEEFRGFNASGVQLEDAKVQITATTTQLRLSYDLDTYTAMRTMPDGVSEFYAVGSAPGFHFITGAGTYENTVGGVRINKGKAIEQIDIFSIALGFAGGGAVGATSWEEITINVTPGSADQPYRATQDVVTVMPANSPALPNEWIAYTGRVSGTNIVKVRVAWFDVTAADSRDWLILVHRMAAV